MFNNIKIARKYFSALKRLFKKTNNFSLRARVLIFVVGIVFVYGVWELLLFNPIVSKRKANQIELQQTDRNVSRLEKQAQMILNDAKQDPQKQLEQRHNDLQKQTTQLSQHLYRVTTQLMPPSEMVQVIKSMLQTHPGLQVHRFTSKKPELVNPATSDSKGATKKTKKIIQTQHIYRHHVLIELEGSFFDILDYLKQMERLPWHIVWDDFEYKVLDYPTASVTVKLHTLSTQA